MVLIDQDRLRGKLIELTKEHEIEIAIQQLKAYQDRAAILNISLSEYMGGKSSDHEGGRKLNYSIVLNQLEINRVSLISTFATTIDVPGVDYQNLQINPNRIKYYCSFKDDISMEQEKLFLSDLINKAIERGISIQLKNQDHNYDGLDVYSWDPRMAELLIELYRKHTDIFLPVPRIFHAMLADDAECSIGWVQEPLSPAYPDRGNSRKLGAHTDRMGKLGALLTGRDLSDGEYIAACKEVGVRPDKPHLLDQALFNQAPEGK